MKFKRIAAFLISAALMIGMMPCLVLADENGSAAEETEAVETTEAAKEDTGSKEKAKETEADKEKEPEDKKPEAEDKASEPEEAPAAEEPEAKEAPEAKDDKETESEVDKAPEEEKGADKDEFKPEPGAIKTREPSVSYKSDKPFDNDKLFNKFVETKLYPQSQSLRKSVTVGSSLTGNTKNAYDALKPKIANVANGKSNSAIFEISITDTLLQNQIFTSESLGVSSLLDIQYDSNGGEHVFVSQEAAAAIIKKLNINIVSLYNALLLDMPYELYWHDILKGIYIEPMVYYQKDPQKIRYNGKMYVYLYVSDSYAGRNILTVNPQKMNTVNTAIKTAKSVVDKAKNLGDYDKLVYYRNWICDQVDYDHDAVSIPKPYGDPWQLISAFDNDPSTNIVCEGYAKAFKYLFDLSTFNNKKLSCICATGLMAAKTSAGYDDGEGHMWNAVDFGDGNSYIIDVTNCDRGTCGYPDKLFLVGHSGGSVKDGYIYSFTNSGKDFSFKYIYDNLSLDSYNDDQLTMNAKDYAKAVNVSGTVGTINWSLDKSGVLKLDGTGAMDNFTADAPAPWKAYAYAIETVSITGGITSIGNYAFNGCTSLKSISIPSSVVSIGSYAFFGCTNLATVSNGTKVKVIGSYAFARCTRLSTFSIKSSVLKKIGAYSFYGDSKLKTIYIQKTKKLSKSGVKKSLAGSSVKTVKVKKSKVRKYKKIFKKSNSGRKVKVKK